MKRFLAYDWDAIAGIIAAVAAIVLHLLHVVPSVHVPYTVEPVVFDFRDFVRQSVDRANAEFAALAARHRLEQDRLTTAVLNGSPAAEILRYADDHDIDLIVLGAHGHGLLDRLLIGSVAERVSRHAPCAVLLVPPAVRRLATAGEEADLRARS